MWTVSKGFIEFVKTLLLFFGQRHVAPGPLTRDPSYTLCVGKPGVDPDPRGSPLSFSPL